MNSLSKTFLFCLVAAAFLDSGNGLFLKKKFGWKKIVPVYKPIPVPIKNIEIQPIHTIQHVEHTPVFKPQPTYGVPAPIYKQPVYEAPAVYESKPVYEVSHVVEHKPEPLLKPADLLAVWDAVKEKASEYNPITKLVSFIQPKHVVVPQIKYVAAAPQYKFVPDVAYKQITKVNYVPVYEKEIVPVPHETYHAPVPHKTYEAPVPHKTYEAPYPSAPYPASQ